MPNFVKLYVKGKSKLLTPVEVQIPREIGETSLPLADILPDQWDPAAYIQEAIDSGIITLPVTTGSGLFEYEATAIAPVVDDGCFLTATRLGATFSRTGGSSTNTEGIITPVAGTLLRSVTIHFTAAQAPGSTYYLNIDYQESPKDVNGSQDSARPVWATVATKPTTFSDTTPATNYIHASTPLIIGIADVDDDSFRVRVRYKIQNYAQQVAGNASILSVIFP